MDNQPAEAIPAFVGSQPKEEPSQEDGLDALFGMARGENQAIAALGSAHMDELRDRLTNRRATDGAVQGGRDQQLERLARSVKQLTTQRPPKLAVSELPGEPHPDGLGNCDVTVGDGGRRPLTTAQLAQLYHRRVLAPKPDDNVWFMQRQDGLYQQYANKTCAMKAIVSQGKQAGMRTGTNQPPVGIPLGGAVVQGMPPPVGTEDRAPAAAAALPAEAGSPPQASNGADPPEPPAQRPRASSQPQASPTPGLDALFGMARGENQAIAALRSAHMDELRDSLTNRQAIDGAVQGGRDQQLERLARGVKKVTLDLRARLAASEEALAASEKAQVDLRAQLAASEEALARASAEGN